MEDNQSSLPIDKRKAHRPNHNSSSTVRKAVLTKESVKRYEVTVYYRNISDEQAQIKKAIIERIMKKGD